MTDCTCKSFPDRMCWCHLGYTKHPDDSDGPFICDCGCLPGDPTRGRKEVSDSASDEPSVIPARDKTGEGSL